MLKKIKNWFRKRREAETERLVAEKIKAITYLTEASNKLRAHGYVSVDVVVSYTTANGVVVYTYLLKGNRVYSLKVNSKGGAILRHV